MEVSGIVPGRRSPDEIGRRLAVARRAESTYDHVGSTLGDAPPGITDRVASLEVEATLPAAAAALRRWAPHQGIGARVVPGDPPVRDATVAVVVPFGPVEMLAPNRIVHAVDAPDRCAVAYATLPGHPEVGEELFDATRVGPRRVRLTIRVHARPATLATRTTAPLTRLLQTIAVRRYLRAWAARTKTGDGGS